MTCNCRSPPLCVCVCVCVCILMATKNERIVTIRLLPLYCRNSARYEAPLKPSTSPRTRKTQKPRSTIPIPRGNKVETHITQSSTEVRRWNQPPLPLVDSISPRSFPPFFIANGKKWEKTMTDNNKTGTNCRRYNTHQIGTMDTNENRFAGPIKLNLGKEINV